MSEARAEPEALERFRTELRAWLPPRPDFPLPQNALTVTTEAQLEWLRAWQTKLYEAGYVGVEWPEAYGGRARCSPGSWWRSPPRWPGAPTRCSP